MRPRALVVEPSSKAAKDKRMIFSLSESMIILWFPLQWAGHR